MKSHGCRLPPRGRERAGLADLADQLARHRIGPQAADRARGADALEQRHVFARARELLARSSLRLRRAPATRMRSKAAASIGITESRECVTSLIFASERSALISASVTGRASGSTRREIDGEPARDRRRRAPGRRRSSPSRRPPRPCPRPSDRRARARPRASPRASCAPRRCARRPSACRRPSRARPSRRSRDRT